MAVVQATIKAALDNLSAEMEESPMTDSDYDNALAGIIRDAILSATVTTPAGVAVQVSVSSGTGDTTEAGIGTVS
jgi:hypothetical protein